ncbi:MAG: hypothetical protein RJA07_1695 [Bacteroidota bacterium]|jgi:hypothetical protein
MKQAITILCFLFFANTTKAQTWYELATTNDSLQANNTINSICNDSAGNIYAAGDFTNSSGLRYVAKWDNSTNLWNELEDSNSLSANGTIQVVCYFNGNIYAAGSFTNSSGKYYVAKWNGAKWNELGGSNNLSANGKINSMFADSNGNIYVAGQFTNSNGKHYVAKWNGTTWNELSGFNALDANDQILSICSDAAGNIYAAGDFWNVSAKNYVAKWNGSTWGELGGLNGLSANSRINTICCDLAGNIYAGGLFTNTSVNYYVAKWNGSAWNDFFDVINVDPIVAIRTDKAGNVYLFDHNNLNLFSIGNGFSYGHMNAIIGDFFIDANNNIYASCFNFPTHKNYVARYGFPLGIEEELKTELPIFPNPTNTATTITLTKPIDNATIKLINLTGQIIIEKQNQTGDHFNLEISQQAQGIYFVEIRQADNVWRTKLVKQ